MDLKQRIRDRGLKQREVAARLGASESAVSLWLSRSADIPTRFIQPLADLLEMPVADVVSVAVAVRSNSAASAADQVAA